MMNKVQTHDMLRNAPPHAPHEDQAAWPCCEHIGAQTCLLEQGDQPAYVLLAGEVLVAQGRSNESKQVQACLTY